VGEKVAAGLVSIVVEAAASYGLAACDLLASASLTPSDLSDPAALVSADALARAFRSAVAQSGDPAFGLRCAETLDVRTQGFWGYALLASPSVRERIALHVRYQQLRGDALAFSFREEGDAAILEITKVALPPDVVPVLMDWAAATTCLQLRKHTHEPALPLHVWLGYPEQPHHRALRTLLKGTVVFEAPVHRYEFAASVLDRRLPGDPYLGKLAGEQLDAQLTRVHETASRGVLEDVRARLVARLEEDASLSRIADDLCMSARTLQRQLGARGTSFHELLEEVRRARATEALIESDEAVESIAVRLGYGDPSNFRRAFRRWTGLSPTAYRAEQRSRTPLSTAVDTVSLQAERSLPACDE